MKQLLIILITLFFVSNTYAQSQNTATVVFVNNKGFATITYYPQNVGSTVLFYKDGVNYYIGSVTTESLDPIIIETPNRLMGPNDALSFYHTGDMYRVEERISGATVTTVITPIILVPRLTTIVLPVILKESTVR